MDKMVQDMIQRGPCGDRDHLSGSVTMQFHEQLHTIYSYSNMRTR